MVVKGDGSFFYRFTPLHFRRWLDRRHKPGMFGRYLESDEDRIPFAGVGEEILVPEESLSLKVRRAPFWKRMWKLRKTKE